MDKFQTKLNLKRDDALNITTSISQSFLIDEVDLGTEFMNIPPALFASLPLIRQDISRLHYNDGHPASEDTLHKMLLLANYLPDARITFKNPSGKVSEAVFPAGTPLYTILCRLVPEIASVHSIVFFVRTQKKDLSRLIVRPSSLPVGLFDMANCIWSVEFAYLPTHLTYNETYIGMLNQWFTDRKNGYNGQKPAKISTLDTYIRELQAVKSQNELNEFLDRVSSKNNSAKLRRFITASAIIKVDWSNSGKEVSLKQGKNKYIELKLSSLRIKKSDGKLIITIDEHDDIEITETEAKQLTDLFNLAVIEKKAEEHPESALSILFPEQNQKECEVPQVTYYSKLNRINKEKSRQLIQQQHVLLKDRPAFGWGEQQKE